MALIVKEFALLLAAFDVGELPPADSESESQNKAMKEDMASSEANQLPRHHHDLVDTPWIASQLKVAFFVDLAEPCEHVGSGNPVVVKLEPSVVDRVVPELLTKVATLDSRKWHMIFETSYLYEKGLNSVVVAIGLKACEHYRMGCHNSEGAGPELHCLDRRSVDHPLIGFLV